MKLLLSEEIAQKEVQLLAKATEKEKCFYHFLNGTPIKMPNLSTLQGDIDKVCFTAFCNGDLNSVKEIIDRSRLTKAVKGVHFTSNLMQICAFALCNNAIRKEELKYFWEKHGVFERFIISKIFSEFSLDDSTPKRRNEELINLVFVKNQIANTTDLLGELIGQCNDLTEFFVIRKAFLRLCEIHPNLVIDKKYKELSLGLSGYIQKKEKITTSIAAIVILFVIASVITFFFFKWEEYKIEPILTALGLGSIFLIWILEKLFKFKFDLEILNSFNNWLFKLIFPKLSKIRELLKKEE